MKKELENAILSTKRIIDARIKDGSIKASKKSFNGYERSYFTTNELIAEYLELVHLNEKMNALTVTASGDHAFNLVTKGILEIDTFDINKLTEFIAFGLKKAMIIKYDYHEYINTLNILVRTYSSLEEITSIILDLIPLMDEQYKIFWKEILNYNYLLQRKNNVSLSLIQILCKDFEYFNDILINNNYLKDEESYNKLKNNLGKANITFSCVDAENLADKFKNKEYDLILLSNILDYFSSKWGFHWEHSKLENYENDLRKIIKEKGIIFLFYIFDYEILYPNKTYRKTDFSLMRDSNVKLDDLTDEIIHSLHNSIHDDNSGIVLVRK